MVSGWNGIRIRTNMFANNIYARSTFSYLSQLLGAVKGGRMKKIPTKAIPILKMIW